MERHRDKNLSKIIQSSSTNTNLRVITRDKNYRIIIFLSLSLFSFSVFVNICSIVFPSPISSHEFPFNTRDSSFKSTNEQHKRV